jgi:hypothetical protein
MKKIIVIPFFLIGCLAILAKGYSVLAAAESQLVGTKTASSTPKTPTVTPTSSLTPTPVSTATLMPLPPITLIFPAPTETTTPTITPQPVAANDTPKPTDGLVAITLSPRVRLLIGLIILLWVILAVFVVIYIRQFR